MEISSAWLLWHITLDGIRAGNLRIDTFTLRGPSRRVGGLGLSDWIPWLGDTWFTTIYSFLLFTRQCSWLIFAHIFHQLEFWPIGGCVYKKQYIGSQPPHFGWLEALCLSCSLFSLRMSPCKCEKIFFRNSTANWKCILVVRRWMRKLESQSSK